MAKGTTTQALPSGFKLQSKERTYEIIRVLGSGSFGITYLATSAVLVGNILTVMKFAIKEHYISASCYRDEHDGATVLMVPTAQSDVENSRKDFITEANRLQVLCNKTRNIVSVNETFEANGTAYYVMEFLDGGSLSKCPEKEAISIVKQIADALNVIHKEHILHLDVKPDNIVLKSNGKNETYPVLIDFGISKHFDSKGKPTSRLNARGASPGYAPQEQYGDINDFSPKYDIYALGAVLFFLCKGKNPPDAFNITPGQQELKRELSGNVSPNIEKAILNAMKPSALERTPSIKQFCDDLMGIDFVPRLNISTAEIRFGKDKGRQAVIVDSNVNWDIYTETKWCKTTKDGNQFVVSVSKNKEVDNRKCTVVIRSVAFSVSQKVQIHQEGTGTIPFPTPRPTPWKQILKSNRKTIFVICSIVGVVFMVLVLYGMYELSKPDPERESRLLSEAIDSMDGKMLEEFADKDSARAYLPFAEFLYDLNQPDVALEYAYKALGYADSVRAKTFIDSVSTSLFVSPDLVSTTASDSPSNTNNTETNDAKFARAGNDFNLMLSLARDNYPKAYYPLAMMYFNKKDTQNAKKWAKISVSANVERSKAQRLVNQITNDELFARAKSIADFESLANKGYSKAYARLAELYLSQDEYDKAHSWAVKAGNAKVDVERARKVVNILNKGGYYDNNEHGGVPNF